MTALPVTRFAVCVVNEGYEASVQRNKIYAVIEDAEAASAAVKNAAKAPSL